MAEPHGAAGGVRLRTPIAHSRGAIGRPRATAQWGVFGPRYAPPLQAVVNHAERFSELLVEVGLGSVVDDDARAWLTHRCEEIALVLWLTVSDWAEGRLCLAEAAGAAALYLDDLHAGARRCLGLGPTLECCSAEASPTIIEVDAHEALTRPVAEAVFRSDPGETWVDPETLLEGLDMRGGDWRPPRHGGRQGPAPLRAFKKKGKS